jgi:hypothetical protein
MFMVNVMVVVVMVVVWKSNGGVKYSVRLKKRV